MPKIELQVAAGNDDTYWDDWWDCCRTWPYGHIGLSGYFDLQHMGFRFDNVFLDSRAKIITARLRLKAAATLSATFNVDLGCEDIDIAPDFLAGSCDPSARVMTAARTNWLNFATIANNWFDTPDFAASLQEVLARPGRNWGDPIAVFAVQVGPAGQHVKVWQYDHAPADAAKLIVTYQWRSGGGSVI